MKPLSVAPNGVVEKAAWMRFERGDLKFARTRGVKLYYNIGGKRKKGETRRQTLIREVKEEVGVDLIPETIRFYNLFKCAQCPGYVPGTKLKMYCYTADCIGVPKVQKKDKVDKLRRLGLRHIGKKITTPMGESIIRHAAKRGHVRPKKAA